MTARTPTTIAGTPEALTLRPVRVKTLRGTRLLTKKEHEALIQMLAVPTGPQRFDVHSLIPKGSYLERIGRHFRDTDISYSISVMQLISVAASWLTQNGAYLQVTGVGRVLPTLWTVGLAPSGSSKTMASEEIDKILDLSEHTISHLPTGSTAAQWILDLHQDNGAFWFQDEVGKFFNTVLTQTHYMSFKAWLLSAYSHSSIGNRLKSEKEKLVIEKPAFTFHGLSVTETWKSDIDITSMLDGFCQRFNYYIASPRRDTDIFEHFLYFEGPEVPRRREAKLLQFTEDRIQKTVDLSGTVVSLINEDMKRRRAVYRKKHGKAPELSDILHVETARDIAAMVAHEILLKRAPRSANIIGIQLDWIAFQDGEARITVPAVEVKGRGQGDADLVVPLGQTASKLLRHYIEKVRTILVAEGDEANPYLFPSQARGRPNQNRPYASILLRVTRLLEEHVGAKMNPHLYRHLIGWIWLKESVDNLPKVQRLLGHDSIQTTLDYYAELDESLVFGDWQDVLDGNRKGAKA